MVNQGPMKMMMVEGEEGSCLTSTDALKGKASLPGGCDGETALEVADGAVGNGGSMLVRGKPDMSAASLPPSGLVWTRVSVGSLARSREALCPLPW